jgi:hypothetical protein
VLSSYDGLVAPSRHLRVQRQPLLHSAYSGKAHCRSSSTLFVAIRHLVAMIFSTWRWDSMCRGNLQCAESQSRPRRQATRLRVPYAYRHCKEGNTTPCPISILDCIHLLDRYGSLCQADSFSYQSQSLRPKRQLSTEGSGGVNYGKDSRVIQLGYDNTNFGRCINDVASQSCKASSLPKAIHANYSTACSCTRCQPCACTIVSSAARLHFDSNT